MVYADLEWGSTVAKTFDSRWGIQVLVLHAERLL